MWGRLVYPGCVFFFSLFPPVISGIFSLSDFVSSQTYRMPAFLWSHFGWGRRLGMCKVKHTSFFFVVAMVKSILKWLCYFCLEFLSMLNLKGHFTQKCMFCHYLVILMLFETFFFFFTLIFLWNIITFLGHNLIWVTNKWKCLLFYNIHFFN